MYKIFIKEKFDRECVTAVEVAQASSVDEAKSMMKKLRKSNPGKIIYFNYPE